MKRIVISVMFLLALLVSTTGTAFAGSALELTDVVNHEGGVKFVFHVTGEFSKEELNSGWVSVEGGDDYPLYCTQKDASTVVCETTDKVGEQRVVVGFGGARFWVDVPMEHAKSFCYNVYGSNSSNLNEVTDWALLGVHCQTNAASVSDWISFIPDPAFTWLSTYYFDETGDWSQWYCNYTPMGPAYYGGCKVNIQF